MVLLGSFEFPVEVLTLKRFRSRAGEVGYEFTPFLADLAGPEDETADHLVEGKSELDPTEIDTVVVPAQEEGFQDTFLAEHRWYQIRIHASMVPRIKFIAAYRTAPTSAITHLAPVKSIEPWEGGPKYVLNFSEPAREIGPIKLVPKGSVKAPQSPRYTASSRLRSAKTLEEVF